MKLRRIIIPLLLLILPACGRQEDEPAASGVTADESAQLDNAAARLDQPVMPPRLTQGDLPKAPLPPADKD